MAWLDFERFERTADALRQSYARAEPFPHAVIDDFLPRETAEAVLREYDQTVDGWNHYHHYNEQKQAVTDLAQMAEATRAVFGALQSRRFIDGVERLTGVPDLIADPDLDAAGLHRTLPGGYLNVHTDFLSHTKNRSWSRQINLLIYLNPAWSEDWNGDLELWDADVSRCVARIAPIFNRCVIFSTGEHTFHGHPQPLACPPGEARRSITLYYFREEGAPRSLRATHYRARPGDSALTRLLIAADRGVLRAFSVAKRYTRLTDGLVDRILRRF